MAKGHTVKKPLEPMTDKEAIKALKAIPGVMKALVGSFRGTTSPKVKQVCDFAIQAIRDRQVLLDERLEDKYWR